MGLQISSDVVLVWNYETNNMVPKYEVWARVVGTKGTIYMEEGPLYCDAIDIVEAKLELRSRIENKLAKDRPNDSDIINWWIG